eukprot:13109925-Ditylum_brightwellii.AAC.1
MKNVVIIGTTIGGGAHGHLSLVLTGRRYLQLTGVNFAPPNNPGHVPVPLPPHHFMEPAELENFCITHCQQLTTHQKYQNMDK